MHHMGYPIRPFDEATPRCCCAKVAAFRAISLSKDPVLNLLGFAKRMGNVHSGDATTFEWRGHCEIGVKHLRP
jgi:hypothetical protein